jgi:hypothetical protein
MVIRVRLEPELEQRHPEGAIGEQRALPSGPEAAAALEEGLALAPPTTLSPTRRRTNYSPRTPALHPGQPFYDHKDIRRAQKTTKSSPQLPKSLEHALVVVAGQGLGNACAG